MAFYGKAVFLDSTLVGQPVLLEPVVNVLLVNSLNLSYCIIVVRSFEGCPSEGATKTCRTVALDLGIQIVCLFADCTLPAIPSLPTSTRAAAPPPLTTAATAPERTRKTTAASEDSSVIGARQG